MNMEKGITEQAALVLGAITILFFSAYVAWFFIFGLEHPRPEIIKGEIGEKEVVEKCIDDGQCRFDKRGSKCGDWADTNFPERDHKFCGCDKNAHCMSTPDITRSGICDQNNRCS